MVCNYQMHLTLERLTSLDVGSGNLTIRTEVDTNEFTLGKINQKHN